VFDNAESPADIRPWLPGGSGHVLITSRERRWAEMAVPVEVDVLAQVESVAILQARVTGLSDTNADQLADRLGNLPLAIAQAAGFIDETGMPGGQYLDLLQNRAGQLLSEGAPESYPVSLAAATELIADRLDHEDPAAAELANLCAFLGPEPIPEDLFTSASGELRGELAARAAGPLAWRQTLAHLVRQSLARIDQRGLVMHRLTQAILRDRLTPEQATAARACTEAILAANRPGDPSNPVTWPKWARLIPHLLAAHLAATDNPGLHRIALSACHYLLLRGDSRTALNLATDLSQHWQERLGDDNDYTRAAMHYLASAFRDVGRYAEAYDLAQDNLQHARRTFGINDPRTLSSASDLAAFQYALGKMQAARELEQDTLDRRRRVLGEDHPETLGSASNLAIYLALTGDMRAARDLDQDILDRRRRVLGEDHPETLASASNLAGDLLELGEARAARDLAQDTLDRRRRVLGEDHPETLDCAKNLAVAQRALEEADGGS
jgi:hypothetical protein